MTELKPVEVGGGFPTLPKKKTIGSDIHCRTIVEDEEGNLWRDDWDPFTKQSHWIKVKEAQK
jgi:hypothetical protein